MGYCPIPPQAVLNRFIQNYTQLVGNASGLIHTNDRYNWRAYNEKLVDIFYSPNAPISNETWADVVQSSFEIDFWPYIQSNQTYTCVNEVMAYSPRNLFKIGAEYTRLGATILLGIVMLY